MAQVRPLLLVVAVFASSLTLAPASAGAPLSADAGDSAIAYNGAALALDASAAGGAAPYTFAWSWGGGASRLANANEANASFDTASLPPQDIIFTLTVTDADGAVATDAVRHRVDLAPILVRRNVTLPTPGLPDELAGGGLDARPVLFPVPAGLARFVAELSWPDNGLVAYDLDMEMLDPGGGDQSAGQGKTARNPERVVIEAPAAGSWTARVLPFLSGPTTATLVVQGFPQGPLPALSLGGPYAFGATDPQRLVARVGGGAGGTAIEWDLDADGVFDAAGEAIATALPVGEHVVRARATDAAGFEVSARVAVSVRDADTILRLRCGGDPTTPYWTMEYSSTKGSCWIHGGHHTYFLGDHSYGLRALTGWIFTVEQQLSPPTEHNTDPVGTTPLHIEISTDGLTWTEVGRGAYRFASIDERQRVDFAAPGRGESFRFVRVSEPLSAAQGLSGYLDHSELDVEADVLTALPALAPAAAPVRGSRNLNCASDIMEDFFVTHPCWFGGIDRWDAASFWHTYPLGDGTRLDHVRGEAIVAPWRLDDWNQGNATGNATGIGIYVQTSVDGVAWEDIAFVRGTFGAPIAFDLALDDAPARFVRLFPEYHSRFDQTGEFAPNHHAKAYFVHSAIIVDGLLPG